MKNLIKMVCTLMLCLILVLALSATAFADGDVAIDETNFPDNNFRSYVSENFDTDGDGALSEDERNDVTYISCSYQEIASLKGIEYFTKLDYLNCGYNQLTSLDVSKNTVLRGLECYINQLTSLDVSKNTALIELHCFDNQLTSLDVSKNTTKQIGRAHV